MTSNTDPNPCDDPEVDDGPPECDDCLLHLPHAYSGMGCAVEPTIVCPDHGDQEVVRDGGATRGPDPYHVDVLACGCHVTCMGPGEPYTVIHREHRPKRAVVIPVEGPVEVIDLGSDSLTTLQAAVGGWIEAVPVPDFVIGSARSTCYVNEEGKLQGLPINRRATDFVVPGAGLGWGDYIAGPMVVAGFDPDSGETVGLPETVERRVRRIEQEAK